MIVGVDPGRNMGIAALGGGELACARLDGRDTHAIASALRALRELEPFELVVEDQHGGAVTSGTGRKQGKINVRTVIKLTASRTRVVVVAQMLEIPCYLVPSATWHGRAFSTVPSHDERGEALDTKTRARMFVASKMRHVNRGHVPGCVGRRQRVSPMALPKAGDEGDACAMALFWKTWGAEYRGRFLVR